VCLLATIAALGQPAIVIVHSRALMTQWMSMAGEWLGVVPGTIGGGRKRNIRPLTIATQQTVWRCEGEPWLQDFGCVVADESMRWSAKTYNAVASFFPARYRIAAGADERRKDNLEFLLHATFGPCVHEIRRDELVELNRLVPIRMEVVPTEFVDEDYLAAVQDGAAPDWQTMIERANEDDDRNALVETHIRRVLGESGENRVLLLNDRVAACRSWAGKLRGLGVDVGLMLGGSENRHELEETIAGLTTGELRVGVGTKVADEGLDIPPLTHVFLTTPVPRQGVRDVRVLLGQEAVPLHARDGVRGRARKEGARLPAEAREGRKRGRNNRLKGER
jgi:superfamily II DNA or RNA helicase